MTVASRKTSVSPESRIERAISFGVRWRFAPSTRAIIRSRNVSPGFALIRTTISSLTTVVPPVTLERMSVPGSLRTGADSPVIAASLTNATPAITSPSEGIVSPSRTTTTSPARSSDEPTSSSPPSSRRRWAIGHRAGPPERRRLGLAAGLGDRLRVRREEDREPEPDRDLDLEPEGGVVLETGQPGSPADREHGHQQRGQLDHEHDGVAGEEARIELAERLRKGGSEERGIEDPARLRRLAGRLGAAQDHVALEAAAAPDACRGSSQKVLPACIRSCSTIGPSDSAGR